MSGGSFDYFYMHAPEKLRSIASDLDRMADACQARAHGDVERHYKTGEIIDLAALAEAGDFLRMLSFRVAGIARVLAALENVTQSVEWWKSGDTGIEEIVEAWKRVTARKGASS